MEKLDKPLTKNYGPLVMWAGNLDDLLSVLKDCTDVVFVADDTKFDSIEEFVKESKGHNPSIVKISTRDPYLRLDLNPGWARIYVSSSKMLPSGLFHKIDAILSRCERKPRFFFQYVWPVGILALSPIIFDSLQLKLNGYLVFAGLIFSWAIYASFVQLWRFTIVQPFYREERPGFVRRNRDAIVIAIISALLGAVGGAVAIKVVDKVWPETTSEKSSSKLPSP